MLIGHGTFDGRTARFNLRGPDVATDELAAWLKPSRRPVVIINGASASAPFLRPLAGPDRVIVTATRSGVGEERHPLRRLPRGRHRRHRRRPGPGRRHLAAGGLPVRRQAGRVVLQARRALLATEHALLEDNGDGRGTPASFFRGLAPGKRPADDAEPDGHRAHQLALLAAPPERALPAAVRRRRDELELKVLKLRDGRAKLSTDAYHARLEPLLLELARIYRRQDRQHPPPAPGQPADAEAGARSACVSGSVTPRCTIRVAESGP